MIRRLQHDRVGLLIEIARAHPELARLPLSVVKPVVVSSPELAHAVLMEKAGCFVKGLGLSMFARPLLGDGLLTLEHAAHHKRRRMLAPAFMPKYVAGYAQEMIARAEVAAARLARSSQVDVAEETMRVTLEIVGKTLFDVEVGADSSEVGAAVSEAMASMIAALTSVVPMPPIVPTPTNLRGRKAVRRLDAVVYRMIAERRAAGETGRSDLLSVLLRARDEQDHSGLSDREVRDEAMTLFLAGHETTANALAWALYLLSSHPQVRARVEAELDAVLCGGCLRYEMLRELPYTVQVVKEAMRLIPPVYMVARRVVREVEIGGHVLPRHTLVMINIIGMQRRPDLYPEPERFDPDRFAPERETSASRHAYLPFSAGPRICIGNHFAMMEAEIILASWLSQLRFELCDTSPPSFEPLLTLRPRGGIAMRVGRRAKPRDEPEKVPLAAAP